MPPRASKAKAKAPPPSEAELKERNQISVLTSHACRARQPKLIRQPLWDQQLRSVHRMCEDEYWAYRELRGQGRGGRPRCNVGLLADDMGLGKTLTALALVAYQRNPCGCPGGCGQRSVLFDCLDGGTGWRMCTDMLALIVGYAELPLLSPSQLGANPGPQKTPQSHVFWGPDENCSYLAATLVVVSHTVMKQWIDAVRQQTRLKAVVLQRKSDVVQLLASVGKVAPESEGPAGDWANRPLRSDGLPLPGEEHLVLCNANRFDELARGTREFGWARIIVDEVCDVKLRSDVLPRARFVWGITGTPQNLVQISSRRNGFLARTFKHLTPADLAFMAVRNSVRDGGVDAATVSYPPYVLYSLGCARPGYRRVLEELRSLALADLGATGGKWTDEATEADDDALASLERCDFRLPRGLAEAAIYGSRADFRAQCESLLAVREPAAAKAAPAADKDQDEKDLEAAIALSLATQPPAAKASKKRKRKTDDDKDDKEECQVQKKHKGHKVVEVLRANADPDEPPTKVRKRISVEPRRAEGFVFGEKPGCDCGKAARESELELLLRTADRYDYRRLIKWLACRANLCGCCERALGKIAYASEADSATLVYCKRCGEQRAGDPESELEPTSPSEALCWAAEEARLACAALQPDSRYKKSRGRMVASVAAGTSRSKAGLTTAELRKLHADFKLDDQSLAIARVQHGDTVQLCQGLAQKATDGALQAASGLQRDRACAALLDSVVADGERCLIFAEFGGKQVQRLLVAKGIKYRVLKGTAFSVAKTRRMLENYDVQVVLVNKRNHGSGSNFHVANRIILYEEPGTEDFVQFVTRAYRHGRDVAQPLQVYMLS